MNFKTLLSVALVALLPACSDSSAPADAESETALASGAPVNWKMTTVFPSSLTILGTIGKRFSEQIAVVSGGNLEFKLYEPGALVPPLEAFDAVSYGAIEAAAATSGYWVGKEPALTFFSSFPFGPDGMEYLAWYYEGGGKALHNEIYNRHNIHAVICGMSPPEASGWYNVRFETPEDLKGMKVRFFGIGGRVLEKLGASAQLLAGGDIMPALELGTIEGAEFSMPAVDLDMGFWQVADYYYFPGWHQQSSLFEIMINLDKWNSLSGTQQAQIESVCGDNVRWSMALGEAIQSDALRKIQAKGVSLENWPPEILDAFRAAWLEVADELSAEDESFAKVWAHVQAFREDYKIWRARGYLAPADQAPPENNE